MPIAVSGSEGEAMAPKGRYDSARLEKVAKEAIETGKKVTRDIRRTLQTRSAPLLSGMVSMYFS